MFFRKNKKAEPTTTAILVAAGNATRMGENKMFLIVDGVPVVAKSLLALQQTPEIFQIIVVSKPEDFGQIKEIVDIFQIDKVSDIVAGGTTRQESVVNGLTCVNQEAKLIAIHDGARPLVSPEIITQVIIDAQEHGGATACVPSKDTVKIADDEGFVSVTPKREKVYLIQTPQVFEKESFLTAVALAKKQKKDFTDDCQLYENAGKKVYLSCGSYYNIKITTPEDLPLAQILSERQEDYNS